MHRIPIVLASVLSATLLAAALEIRGQQSASPDNSSQNTHVTQTADSQPNTRADRITAAQVLFFFID